MRVLVACEFSGVVRDAFRDMGHDAISCDLLGTERPGPHIQGDIIDVLEHTWDMWDMMIAHPPCTFLTVTGNRWMAPKYRDRFPERWKQRQEAINFFITLATVPIPKICIENPVGIISTVWRKPDQYVHPYYFGDPQSKKTGLWLVGLPNLVPTSIVEPEFYIFKDGRRDPMWHFQTLKLPPDERSKARSRTFDGIARAMAAQWG